MDGESAYRDYVADERFLSTYNAYQERYAVELAERDKVMIDLVRANAPACASILDIGCSTGNLLKHMHAALPDCVLTGGDMALSSLDAARLAIADNFVHLTPMDMLHIEGEYDVIVANAVTYLFDGSTYTKAVASAARALKSKGVFISFEWAHPFGGQDIAIVETTDGHPRGLPIHARPYRKVRDELMRVGFAHVSFHPFEMPFDIAAPEDPGGTPVTYTEETRDGRRLSFRGALYQPWCHVVARMPP